MTQDERRMQQALLDSGLMDRLVEYAKRADVNVWEPPEVAAGLWAPRVLRAWERL